MFEFKFTLNEANQILAALGKLPFEDVTGLITNIRTQAEPQIPRVQQEMAEASTQAAESVAAEVVETAKASKKSAGE